MKFTLRRILAAALSLTLLGGTLAGCGKDDTTMESEAAETAVQGVTFTDALGTEVQIESWIQWFPSMAPLRKHGHWLGAHWLVLQKMPLRSGTWNWGTMLL